MHFRKLSFCQTQVLRYRYRGTRMNFSGFDMQVVRLLDLMFSSGFNPYEMEFMMIMEAFVTTVAQWQGLIFVTQ